MLAGQLRSAPGFFRLGDSTICYGQCASGDTHPSASGLLHDALDQVIVEDSRVLLPFDPTQVIDNLRAERYRGQHRKAWHENRMVIDAYYSLRPFMPISLRKYLQRLYLRGWREIITFPEWPVDFTVEQIYERLLVLALKARRGRPIPFIWFWPNGAPSCTVVTHDVETQAGVDFCPELMDLNDSFAIKASFQLVPEERYAVPESLLAQIRSRGFEVNVHDLNHDGHLFRDRTEFLRRAKLINRYVRSFGADGFRSAIMYRNIDWYDALDVSYDMSLPNVSHLDPQQGGCCTALPFFIGNIVELPVTMTQDYSLIHILGQYSTAVWLEQIKRIREKNGLINVIVHPDYLTNQKACHVYKELLVHLASLRSAGSTWIALPKDAADWWRQRSRLELVSHGDSWRIVGEGRERASLAFATLEGDSLRYQLAR